jgi:L-asparaginase/Glu-tRNA(Gln) amidotransferase subunit D
MIKTEKLQKPQTRIGVVYAGGTISSLATPQGYREGGHAVDLVGKLEKRIPNFKKNFELGGTEVAYTGLSENMDPEYLTKITSATINALNMGNKAVVITHGTDSMEQTAQHLQNELGDFLTTKEAKIIITGANEDLEHPQTDAWDNLIFAFDNASKPVGNQVFVAFHKKLIPAISVIKEPFNGKSMNYISKDSWEYKKALELQNQKNQKLIEKLKIKMNENNTKTMEYFVNIVRPNHQNFLADINNINPKAVLLTLYHSGTANTEKPELSVAELVSRLREEKGIIFFGVTENGEPVDLHSYETSVKLREAGVVPLYNMEGLIAKEKLSLLPLNKMDNGQIIDAMLTDLIGEIDSNRIISEDIQKLKLLYEK